MKDLSALGNFSACGCLSFQAGVATIPDASRGIMEVHAAIMIFEGSMHATECLPLGMFQRLLLLGVASVYNVQKSGVVVLASAGTQNSRI